MHPRRQRKDEIIPFPLTPIAEIRRYVHRAETAAGLRSICLDLLAEIERTDSRPCDFCRKRPHG